MGGKPWCKLGSKFFGSRLLNDLLPPPPGASISELFGIGTLGYLSRGWRSEPSSRLLLVKVAAAWGGKKFHAAKKSHQKTRNFSLHGDKLSEKPRLIGTCFVDILCINLLAKIPKLWVFGETPCWGPNVIQFLSSRPVYGELSLSFLFENPCFWFGIFLDLKKHTWQQTPWIPQFRYDWKTGVFRMREGF